MRRVDTALFGTPPCDCTRDPWPVANTIVAPTYAEALRAGPNLVKNKSDVGRTWCTLLNWPVSLSGGVLSIFGFSNAGGTIGTGVGVVGGAIAGGWHGGDRRSSRRSGNQPLESNAAVSLSRERIRMRRKNIGESLLNVGSAPACREGGVAWSPA
jgi:hypothetical protein